MRVIVASIVFMISLSVFADVYKWSDDQGQVHYGDRPGDVDAVEEVKIDANTKSGVALDDDKRDEKRRRLLDAMQEDREEKTQKREKHRVEQEQRQRRCAYLQDRLRRAQAASGVYDLDKNGNRVYLSGEGRKQSENNLRTQINKYCS